MLSYIFSVLLNLYIYFSNILEYNRVSKLIFSQNIHSLIFSTCEHGKGNFIHVIKVIDPEMGNFPAGLLQWAQLNPLRHAFL